MANPIPPPPEADAENRGFVRTSIEEWLGGYAVKRQQSGTVWRHDVLRSERDRNLVYRSSTNSGWSRNFRPADYLRDCRQLPQPGPMERAIARERARAAKLATGPPESSEDDGSRQVSGE